MEAYAVIFRIVLLAVLLFFSGFFSASETAVTSLNYVKVKQLQQKQVKGAEVIGRLVDRSTKILSATLVGNNLANTAATAIATELVVQLFGGVGVTAVVTFVMTSLILIFGEITPKTYASHNGEKVALRLGTILLAITTVLYPLLKVLNFITTLIIKVLGGEMRTGLPFVTEEEIRTLVKVGREEGIIHQQESKMIDSIFEFDDTYVTEVMVPRIDIVAVDSSSTLEEVMQVVERSGFSRIPVYEGDIDNIVGILHVKDLIKYSGSAREGFNIKQVMRETYYVPEGKKLNQLLREMKKEKVHMAIVLDQYGGTAGLVTIEDVVEEIVGEIEDEFDMGHPYVVENKDGSLTVSGKVTIQELNEGYGLDLPEDEYETLGGLVFNRLGRLPRRGDRVNFGRIVAEVKNVERRRIDQIKIYIQRKGDTRP